MRNITIITNGIIGKFKKEFNIKDDIKNDDKFLIKNNKDNNVLLLLIINYKKKDVQYKEILDNENFLKTLGNFSGELKVNLKKFNEIKFDVIKRKKDFIEKIKAINYDAEREMNKSLDKKQENFNDEKQENLDDKFTKDINSIITFMKKDISKIFFSSSKDDFKTLMITKNKELIINPEISKCFTEEQWKIINESKENTEKNLNTPSTILENNNVEKQSNKNDIEK